MKSPKQKIQELEQKLRLLEQENKFLEEQLLTFTGRHGVLRHDYSLF